MVRTCAGKKNIFSQVDQINIADMHIQAFGYFVLQVFVNINQVLPNPLVVSSPQNLSNTIYEVQNFYDRVRSDMIAKAI